MWLSCAGRQWRHLLTAAVLLRAIASVQQPQLPQTLTLQGVLLESDAASGDGGAEYSPQLAAHVDQLHAAAMEVADDGAAAWPAVAEECGEAAVQAAVAFVGAIEEAGLYDLATTPVVRRNNRVLLCLSTGLLLSHACVDVLVCGRHEVETLCSVLRLQVVGWLSKGSDMVTSAVHWRWLRRGPCWSGAATLREVWMGSGGG